MTMWQCLLGLLMVIHSVYPGPRYSSRIVTIQSGQIRGIIIDMPAHMMEPVEGFLGIPYAAPPVGEQRLRPPKPPLPWLGTRLADTTPQACPQRSPLPTNVTTALQKMPRDRYLHLRRLSSLLRNQSEDCLSLNVYVPASGSRGDEAPYAIMVYIHGEGYEYGAGHAYDVSVWASHSHVISVTLNYRLGPIGFLKVHSHVKSSCLALRDIEAALHWIQQNIVSFGGDPGRVTLVGHDTGAVLVNMLLLQPSAIGLFHRAVLISGSILSPWSLSPRPDSTVSQLAALLGCPLGSDLAKCLRRTPLSRILAVDLPSPRFLPVYGPWFTSSSTPLDLLDRAGDSFISRPLMFAVMSTESYLDFNNHQIQYGFEEVQRNRILRTFIRNAFTYHLNELFSTIRNEYTDWDKPIIHPINLRDSALEALSDGHTVSPMVHLAILHSRRGSTSYMMHFNHQTRQSDYIQRLGSLRGEDLPYLLGVPLVGGNSLYPGNFTRADINVSETLLNFVTNFAKTGNPNEPRFSSNEFGVMREKTAHRGVVWDPFNPNTQMYLSLGVKPRMRSHYRGHKMSVWLNLVPQLHRPGTSDVTMTHHAFLEREHHHYDGILRTEVVRLPEITTETPHNHEDCDNTTVSVKHEGHPQPSRGDLTTRRPPAGTHIKSRGLAATMMAGILLVLLNILIVAATIFQRRQRRRQSKRQQKTEDVEGINVATFSANLQLIGKSGFSSPPLTSPSYLAGERVDLEDEIAV